MKKFLNLLFRCAVPFLIYFTIENVMVLAVEILRPELWEKPEFPLAVTGLMDLLTIPLLFGLYRADGKWRRRPPDRSAKTGWRQYLLSAVCFLGIYLAVNLLLDAIGISGSDEDFQEISESIESASAGLQFLVAGIIGPVMEEFLFRGLLLRRTEDAAGPVWAMLLSALLFGVFHGNLTQGAAAFLLGVFLGAAYLCTDSLLVPILMHAAANSSATVMGLPGAAQVLDSDLFYLAVPLFCALALGGFLRMYAEPFRALLRTRRERAAAERLPADFGWPEDLPEEEIPETAEDLPENMMNGTSGKREPDDNKGDMR